MSGMLAEELLSAISGEELLYNRCRQRRSVNVAQTEKEP